MINLEETFEKYNDEFLEDKQIKNPLHKNRDIHAFLLLDKLAGGANRIIAGAEHDEVYLSTDCEKLAEVATEADILTLVRLGVIYEDDNLTMFV